MKVAACQLLPASKPENRKNQFQRFLQMAEHDQVDFLCLPEGFLTGYYAEECLARKNALDVREKAFADWVEMTKGYSVTVIVGFNELSSTELFDSAAVLENGLVLGIQRKHYLYHHYFSSGIDFSPFQSKGVTFGVLICLDTNYFEPARLLALKGASILFSPMCNKVPLNHPYAKRPPYYSHFVARTHENRCWLVTSDWIWPNDENFVCPGHTVIYNPDGQEVTRSEEGKEQVLTYNIPSTHLYKEKGRRVIGSAALADQMAKATVMNPKSLFTFKPIEAKSRALIHSWLMQPHVAEWFYGEGLQNTLRHLDEFLQDSCGYSSQYWLGYDQDHPFAFLITSSVSKPDDALAGWCLKEGTAITLDLLIGDTSYLGKGFSHVLIREFLLSQFPNAVEVLIDPEVTNSRAVHVYQKVGFKILDKFIPSHSPHPHYMMRLDMSELRD